MGRNNQHAGMHMKWWHGDHSQGDFSGYDRYVDMIAESKLRKMTNGKNTKDPDTTKPEGVISDGKKSQVITTAPVNESQANKPKKKKNKNPKYQPPVKEKQQLISDEYFAATYNLYANIFAIAFEKRIDVFDYICECERLCAEDKYMCETRKWFALRPLEKSHIFLHMLADKIGCEIHEFFIMNEEMRQKRLYSIFKNILKRYDQKKYLPVSFDQDNDSDFQGNEFTITCLTLLDYHFSNPQMNTADHTHYYTTHYIHKIVNNTTGDVMYSLNIKTSTNYKTELLYMYERAEIYAEPEGEMGNFFEKCLQLYLGSGESIGSCVTW